MKRICPKCKTKTETVYCPICKVRLSRMIPTEPIEWYDKNLNRISK